MTCTDTYCNMLKSSQMVAHNVVVQVATQESGAPHTDDEKT